MKRLRKTSKVLEIFEKQTRLKTCPEDAQPPGGNSGQSPERLKNRSDIFHAKRIISSPTIACFTSFKYQAKSVTNISHTYSRDDVLPKKPEFGIDCPELRQVMRWSKNMTANIKSGHKDRKKKIKTFKILVGASKT